ncbi:valyl-tRNA synthetase-like protein [Phyllosticta citrichinensis]|uniref:valine--tRNA ligase n=1 Tax=Phyllosticta citrichinensis TaxID=1130410 RepID=A0ABR1Y280_9PEZI
MAHNHASHNPTGEKTGPVTGPPPPVSNETAAAAVESSKQDPTGQQAPGKDGEVEAKGGAKPKTPKELEKERQKAEKAKKFAEKQAKKAALAEATVKNVTKKKTTGKQELAPYVEETPKGQKKILKSLDDDYHKAYIPSVVESAWYDWWEKEGYFEPEFGPDGKVKPAGYFVISEPPPNVTGALHVGHALATSLQDTMIRWNRMRGKTVLYVPGCDHAGISTQSVVEKMLWRREKKTRHDLGRQAMVQRIWDWKGEYHQRINNVLKRMGGSFDWTREAFTMDENLSEAVTETFVKLHEEGLIYRSNRLVNWCTSLRTALSNLEVDNKDIEGRTLLDVPGYERKVEFGVITHFKYPIEGSEETIEVATTRPETMLGDSGIAVHPEDKRYKHLVGKKAKHPFVDRLLPIVADTYVDPEFGTGAVKITPAHDPNDFSLGQRHNLEFINVLTDDGLLNNNGGMFEGQKRFDVRYTVVDELTKLGLYVKKENNPMRIPLCQRTKDVIEPIVKPQWWMRMKSLAEPAIKAVRDGDIKIRPATAEADYFRWLENIQDWCLSRQLWWGHQAPAYFIQVEGENNSDADDQYWVVGRDEAEAKEKAAKKFPGKTFTLRRDEDVLDTWFSSGLWPFSTLGWPKQTPDMEKLYPTNILETGWDILFFWVARMIMLGLKLTGQVPFREVYCHSLIRDSEGRKMSKSLGNVVDPIDIMEGIKLDQLHAKLLEGNLDPKELKVATKYQQTAFPQGIPDCGADALRFSLVQYTTGGGDINFDVKVMHAYRRFCNKVYQATKFVLGGIDADFVPREKADKTGKETLAERWILHKLSIASRDINKALEDREFAKSTQIAWHFFHDDLCDVFIESSKPLIYGDNAEARRSAIDTLYTALEGGLTMLHPYMPFLTEELWQRLNRRPGDKTPSIMRAAYPEYRPDFEDAAAEASYDIILDAAAGARSLISKHNVKGAKSKVKLAKEDAEAKASLEDIKTLSIKGLSEVELWSSEERPQGNWDSLTTEAGAKVWLEVPERPATKAKEVADLEKELGKTTV